MTPQHVSRVTLGVADPDEPVRDVAQSAVRPLDAEGRLPLPGAS